MTGIVSAMATNKEGRLAGIRVRLRVNTKRGQQESVGFLPCGYLHRIPGTVRPNTPAVGAVVEAEVLEIDTAGGDRPNLVLRQM